MIGKAILPASKTPPKPEDVSQAAKIKERIRRWKDGQFKELWEEAVAMQKVPPKRGRKRKQQEVKVSQEVRNAT